MAPSAVPPAGAATLDEVIEAYEAAWEQGGSAELADFLPAPGHPLHLLAARELLRIELEFHWNRGRPRLLDEYRARLPELFTDRTSVQAVAYEEYRLRCQAGETPRPAEYAARFGVDVGAWPRPEPAASLLPPTLLLDQPKDDPLSFPQVGSTFLGFHLISELGRGSFGRVYLAEQADLAGRRVALKVTTAQDALAEPQTLARLQHTHIVPVYSTHRTGKFEAVCMPYLGGMTLAHLLEQMRNVASWPTPGRELVGTVTGHKAPTWPDHAGPTSGLDDPAPVVWRTLERFDFADAILWIGARLADGLAHAHERGILHRDLKPANILLTDDGQPMLLDFNLAADANRAGSFTRVAGTVPYMAPEQLAVALGSQKAPDARADVYALGVILFELLTGRHPFPDRRGPLAEVAPLLFADRSAGPPRLRDKNPRVTPATESIIRRCLEPDPARRYQSARDLKDDLERQLAHQPLRHVREPSWRERWRKWRWRHPRLTSATAIGAVAAVLVVATGVVAAASYAHAKSLAAERAFQQERESALSRLQALREVVQPVTYKLVDQINDARLRPAGIAQARQALDQIGAIQDDGWLEAEAWRSLTEDERTELRGRAGELWLLLASAENRSSPGSATAFDYNRRAELCLTDSGPTVREQRAELFRGAGNRAEANRWRELAGQLKPRTARDFYLAAVELTNQGRLTEAEAQFGEATRRDPQHSWAWFLLGSVYDRLHRDTEAEGAYSASIAAWPDHSWAYYNRGLTYSRRNLHAEAVRDFTDAIRLNPDQPEPYVNRALALMGMKRPTEAERDLTKPLEMAYSPTWMHLLRAQARATAGDADGAKRDRAEAFRLIPTDEYSWLARGKERMEQEPLAARADYEEALQLNPRSFEALQNLAYLFDAKLNRPADSLAMLDRAIAVYPNAVKSRGGRGVLLARRGDRAAALRDAEVCLRNSRDAEMLYQVAGIYALTSRTHPKDQDEALRLLAAALRQGYGLNLVDRDSDLDPIRNLPAFRRVVAAARELAIPANR